MKRVFALTFFLFCNYVNAENTIIAIVNGDLVSLKSIENELFQANSKKEKIDLVNSRINIVIQLQKAAELNLLPTKKISRNNKVNPIKTTHIILVKMIAGKNINSDNPIKNKAAAKKVPTKNKNKNKEILKRF